MADNDTAKRGMSSENINEEEGHTHNKTKDEQVDQREKGEKGGQTQSGNQTDPMQDWPSDLLDE